MSLYHLTYLAGILDRTPLIPPFYIPPAGPRSRLLVPASQVFDFDQFKSDVNVTGMDWTDVRPQSETAKLEQLGCWTASVADAGELAERTSLMQDIGLDPSFYPLRVPTLPAKPHEIPNDLQCAYSQPRSLKRRRFAKLELTLVPQPRTRFFRLSTATNQQRMVS